jgi:hypothetical protein
LNIKQRGILGVAGRLLQWSGPLATDPPPHPARDGPRKTAAEPVQHSSSKGELRSTGPDCYSIWVRWTHDFIPLPYSKRVTLCGTGSAPADIRLDPYRLTTTGYLKVCRGAEDTEDCGEAVSLTSWPIKPG